MAREDSGEMSIVIMWCFGTLDTHLLTNAQFFNGVDCLLDRLECVAHKMETVHNHDKAIKACLR